jgi:hypothetical protein
MTASLREHASCKRSPSFLTRQGEEETQEELPGAEPQFVLHGCEVPQMLSPLFLAMCKQPFCVLVPPLPSAVRQEEKQGLQH